MPANKPVEAEREGGAQYVQKFAEAHDQIDQQS
jgi:hypothetical protein